MTYDFKQTINRENTRSVKYDFREKLFGRQDVLPMWVADMDFTSVPELQDALIERAKHNVYGYTSYDDAILNAILGWLKNRHQFEVSTDLLSFSPGVIPSLHALVQTFTAEHDQIVIQPPVYPPFFSVIKSHNRELVENPLMNRNGRYEMDFEHLEELFKQGAKAFILCSPHNPVGRVWTKEELTRLADLCVQYNVYLFSNEIHADIVFKQAKHYPVATLNEEINQLTFTLMAPSKTFNIAGLQASFVVSPNQELKEKFDQQLMQQGFASLNTFAFTALEAVYKHGEPWLDGLIKQLEENKALIDQKLKENEIGISSVYTEGTYLIWLDFSGTGLKHDDIKRKLNDEAKVGLNEGKMFGAQGEQFMRMNIAAPPETVEEGINRIIKAFKS
ncbi:MalY/PatB family protein [Tenuibacillus multivorans]|uniref:cysteine-S-conjugate beta-lyase n=1 Tax=Tenuibacillus multivorans TaxID=237069 RepID=A0A1H0FSF0_9BACI|nr:PatB family C-S lyase [Tenuibacillus multivorans]GEL77908.1 aminotransferase [Tenuibacillus multivorans]SDN97409.1 cystathione beta-lyase [Tenuibacillus multivorans]